MLKTSTEQRLFLAMNLSHQRVWGRNSFPLSDFVKQTTTSLCPSFIKTKQPLMFLSLLNLKFAPSNQFYVLA